MECIPDGRNVSRIARLAAELGIYVVLGVAEVDSRTSCYYNSAALFGPEGQHVGTYRKTHLYADDVKWAVEGDGGIPCFETRDIGRLAMLICMDADYIEPARIAALHGSARMNSPLYALPDLSCISCTSPCAL